MKYCFLILVNFLFFIASAQEAVPASVYSFNIGGINGRNIDLSAYKGKKIMIVNTPINHNYSRQYYELEQLYQKYKGKLVIIGVLANDFLLEPDAKKANQRSSAKEYHVSYPIASKLIIRGDAMAPLYKWLTEQKYNKLKDSEVKWDFQKYLIDESGTLVAVFDPKVKAESPEIVAAVER